MDSFVFWSSALFACPVAGEEGGATRVPVGEIVGLRPIDSMVLKNDFISSTSSLPGQFTANITDKNLVFGAPACT
jgi:hypothetical protein